LLILSSLLLSFISDYSPPYCYSKAFFPALAGETPKEVGFFLPRTALLLQEQGLSWLMASL
jgi:hypothetical protein